MKRELASPPNLAQEAMRLAQEVISWMNTQEGQKVIHKNFAHALKATAELENARRIDIRSLQEPFTL